MFRYYYCTMCNHFEADITSKFTSFIKSHLEDFIHLRERIKRCCQKFQKSLIVSSCQGCPHVIPERKKGKKKKKNHHLSTSCFDLSLGSISQLCTQKITSHLEQFPLLSTSLMDNILLIVCDQLVVILKKSMV